MLDGAALGGTIANGVYTLALGGDVTVGSETAKGLGIENGGTITVTIDDRFGELDVDDFLV